METKFVDKFVGEEATKENSKATSDEWIEEKPKSNLIFNPILWKTRRQIKFCNVDIYEIQFVCLPKSSVKSFTSLYYEIEFLQWSSLISISL